MSRVRKTAHDRKAEIVATAIRLAAEVGPDRVTAQALSQAVGISQPAVFRHFATMSDLWKAVGEYVARRMDMDEMAPDDADPVRALSDLVALHLHHIDQTPAIPAILFSRELHVANEQMRVHFEQVMANRRAGFAALIERARVGGQFRSDVDAADAAAVVVAAIQGLALRWSLENYGFDLPVEGARLIALVIDGLRAG